MDPSPVPASSVAVACQCGKRLGIHRSQFGKHGVCPACKQTLWIIFRGDGQDGFKVRAGLIVRGGPNRVGEQFFLLDDAPFDIGKLPERDLQLIGAKISRTHCRLTSTSTGWRVQDCKSTNGLFVNGERVTDRELNTGDRLRIGEFELEFVDGAAKRSQSEARRSTGAKASGGPSAEASEDNGIYKIADEDAWSALADGGEVIPTASAVGAAHGDAENLGEPSEQGHAVCPSCKKQLAKSAKICIACGIDIKTGLPILTSQDTDLDEIYVAAEGIIRWLSWIDPIGIYPIASEAFGTRKPYFIRTVAVITAIISLWFLGLTWTDSPKAARWTGLMLWSGDLTNSGTETTDDEWSVLEETEAVVDAAAEAEESDSDSDALGELGDDVSDVPPEVRKFAKYRPVQLISHAFLHTGLLHLAGNLLFLLVFGSRVNALLGNGVTFLLYLLLAVGSAMAHLASVAGERPSALLGASGAIMGLAGMYFVFFPIHKVHMAAWLGLLFPIYALLLSTALVGMPLLSIPSFFFVSIIWLRWALANEFRVALRLWAVRGYWVVLFYIGFDVFYTVMHIEDGIAHWAHLGGFLIGAALALVLLFTRLVNARGGDLVSTILGKRAWALVGRPRPGLGPLQRLP